MDLLKQLNEAKAQGLSKEEFFRLVDAEIKLSEHKQQTSVGSDKGSAASSADVSKQLAKFLQDVDERLKTQEQQQSARFNEYMREQQQQFQQFQQQHQQHFQLFQQQRQQQLQHLQQQQERQHAEHIQQLQQQQQQMLAQVQPFEKNIRTAQSQPSQHGEVASDHSKEHQKEKQNFDAAISQVKENFHEMRNTVLNRLEEEKIYMRDELSKAQLELKADLSKVLENVTQIKNKLELTDLINMRDNINKIMNLYEEKKRNAEDEEGFLNVGRKEIMDQINVAQENMEKTRNLVLELKDVIMKQTEGQQAIAEDRLRGKFETLQENLQQAAADIIAVTDKESQLIKNYLIYMGASPRPRKRYVCDFLVKDFEKLINTIKVVDSLPWYIEQFRSCVKGSTSFTEEGDMEIWLLYARIPRAVGLKPQSNISVKVRTSVVDLTGDKKPLLIGEDDWEFNENEITDCHNDWGLEVGSVKCAEVVEKGMPMTKDKGAIIIRFEIQIL